MRARRFLATVAANLVVSGVRLTFASDDSSELEEIIKSVARREKQLADALGPYKFYIYEGGAFDAISTDLLAKQGSGTSGVLTFNEYRAPIWIHRALQVWRSKGNINV